MVAPRVLALPPGTFQRWRREAGKDGERHRTPRVTNGRDLADALVDAARDLGDPAPLAEALIAR
jgi:hypothetical protein